MSQKKKKDKKRVTPGWTDISGPGQFFIQKFHVLPYADFTQPYKPTEYR